MKTVYTILCSSIILSSCGTNSKPTTTKEESTADVVTNTVQLTKEQATLAQLELAPIQQGKMKGMTHLNGVIDVPPTGIASVSIPMGGYVHDIIRRFAIVSLRTN